MAENEELRRRLLSGIDAKAVKAEQDMNDILRMLDELMRLKQGMGKENQELAEKNRLLREKLAKEERDVEKLQMHLCESQEKEGGAAIRLHRALAKHVRDMHGYKTLLDYDREFVSTDLHITKESELISSYQPEETYGLIEIDFNKEVALLAKLFEANETKGREPATIIQSFPKENKSRKDDDVVVVKKQPESSSSYESSHHSDSNNSDDHNSSDKATSEDDSSYNESSSSEGYTKKSKKSHK